MTPLAAERRRIGPLLERLERIAPDAERVYLCGERPGTGTGVGGWADSLPDGWDIAPAGHYLEGEHPVVRVARPDGRPLEIMMAAAWYGDGDYPADIAASAWQLLGDELRRGFGPDAVLLSSPAATGRDLFVRAIPRGVEWPTLPDELQSLVRATTGQGRIELLNRERVELPRLVGYDGRMMYAALCRELPTGPAEHRRVSEYLGYTRARYDATARVPTDWNDRCACGAPGHRGLGLLGDYDPTTRAWSYPSEPGATFSGWWDGAELQVALAHGWTFNYHTALVFSRARGQGPLDGWASRLISARDRLALLAGQRTPDHGHTAVALAAAGVRAIVLHAIGAFFAGARRVTRSCPIDQAEHVVPSDAHDRRSEGDRFVWTETHAPAWPELCHPEWSAAVWARARSRLLDAPTGSRTDRAGALHVPASSLVAFRTDAIYMDADPAWHDDGRPGRFRRQLTRNGPLAAPATHTDLVELAR